MSIHGIVQLVSRKFIHWIVIYPVDSTIQFLNNWARSKIRQQCLLSHFDLAWNIMPSLKVIGEVMLDDEAFCF